MNKAIIVLSPPALVNILLIELEPPRVLASASRFATPQILIFIDLPLEETVTYSLVTSS